MLGGRRKGRQQYTRYCEEAQFVGTRQYMGGIDDKGPVTADEEVRIREAYACRESPWSCGAAAAAARVP
jgi:hypothetical protein